LPVLDAPATLRRNRNADEKELIAIVPKGEWRIWGVHGAWTPGNPNPDGLHLAVFSEASHVSKAPHRRATRPQIDEGDIVKAQLISESMHGLSAPVSPKSPKKVKQSVYDGDKQIFIRVRNGIEDQFEKLDTTKLGISRDEAADALLEPELEELQKAILQNERPYIQLEELVRKTARTKIDPSMVRLALKRIERRRALEKMPSPFGSRGADIVVHSDSVLEQQMKTFLKKKFNNLVLAWRLGLDTDGSGKLSYAEFSKAMSGMNYKTNFKQLWKDMDDDNSGTVSLVEIDPEASALLREFRDFLNDYFESLEEAWANLDTDRSLRLTRKELEEGLDRIGFGTAGAHNTIFSYLITSGGGGFVSLQDFEFLGLPRDPKYDMRKVVLRQKTKRQEFEFEPLKVSKNGEEEDLQQMPHGALMANVWADFYKTNNMPGAAVTYTEEALRVNPDSKHLQTERHSLLAQIARKNQKAPAPLSRRNSKIIPFELESKSNPPPVRPASRRRE
jgi:Ca2+-binding EF-hand superfamily protein